MPGFTACVAQPGGDGGAERVAAGPGSWTGDWAVGNGKGICVDGGAGGGEGRSEE